MRPWHRTGLAAAFAGIACLATAGAVAGPAEEERWQVLQELYFAGRTVEEAGPVVSLDAPTRAHDSALVPIRVATAPEPGVVVTAVHLIVDNNPVPRAMVLRFPDGTRPHAIDTRLRVDAYTNVTAIAETADGRLLKTARFVKAAGGCSAPSPKNAQLAALRLGKMKLNLPETVSTGKPATAQLLISHPNYTGFQYDQLNHYYIPAHYVKSIGVRYNGEPVLDVEADISMSEDPSLHFTIVPEKEGTLEVVAEDTKGRIFKESWPIRTTPGS